MQVHSSERITGRRVTGEIFRVLLVEDNPVDARLVRALLEGVEYPSVALGEVSSLGDALERLEGEHFDVVLLDLFLPDARDLEAVERVLAEIPQVPVVVLTIHDEVGLGVRAVQMGAQDYLIKSRISPEALLRVLRFAVERKAVQEHERRTIRERTAREEAESAQREINSILESITDAFFAVDEKWLLTYANRELEVLTGMSREELLGENLWELFPNPPENRLWTELHRAMEERVAVEFEEYGVNIGIWAYTRAYPRAEGLTIYMRDITERKKAEGAIRQSLREKEALLQEVHHRVKNNLQVISSLLNMQMRAQRDPEALEALRESRERVQAMALIHETLYSTGEYAELDLADYLKKLAAQLQRSLSLGPRVRVELDLGRCAVPLDLAVPLGLIASELVTNAFKHAFPEGRRGEVRVELHAEGDGRYSLRVGDNGVGLRDGEVGDSSVGMNLIQGLVRQVGGEMKVRHGGGTEFRITFAVQDQGER